jgi:thiosulfate dehydrogenase [quinone] large subunit
MMHPRASGDTWLAVIRIGLGVWFVKSAFTKLGYVLAFGVLPLPGANDRFLAFQAKQVAEWAANPDIVGFYRWFLDAAVVPNAALFAHLQAVGETVVGLGLILGLFTPFVAGLGLFLTLNYALATWHRGTCQQGFHFLLIVCFLAVLFGHGWRRLSLDARRRGYRSSMGLA